MRQNNGKARLWAKGAILLIAGAIALTGCGTKPVAVYKLSKDASGTQKVTTQQFDTFMGVDQFVNGGSNPYYSMMASDPSFKESKLKELISYHIFASQVKAADKTKAEKDASDQIKQLNDSLAKDATQKKQFDDTLKKMKITTKDLQDYLALRGEVIAYLDAQISDDDLKKTYDDAIKKDPNAFVEKATVRHILVAINDPSDSSKQLRTDAEALARAQEVEAKLKAGGDWKALAKQYSDDPGSADNGGEYKDATIAQWDPDFAAAVMKQPVGEIGDPVKSSFGYHIILVESRSSNKFDDVKDQVKGQAAGKFYSKFETDDLPGLIVSTNLPKDTSKSGTSGTGTTSGDAGTSGTDAGTTGGDSAGTSSGTGTDASK